MSVSNENNYEKYENLAKEKLKTLTPKEKAHMMAGDRNLILFSLRDAIRYNARPIPAGVISEKDIPGIKFSDGPRGCVQGSSTCFPVSMARGASWDVDLEEKIGNAIGIEIRAHGANYFGGVCINLLRHPLWGRAQETYGEDPTHLGKFGVALTNGIQNHAMACAKHYACNSMENSRFKVNVQVDERSLREIYLYHFRKCVEAGVASLMNAYNKVNGYFCGHNSHLLTDIAKNEWKFKGFIITDFLVGIRNGEKAINAGVDIEMPYKWRMTPKKILRLLHEGKIKEEQIDNSIIRILTQTYRFKDIVKDEMFYTMDKVACNDHIALALESAQKSIVLLKNSENFLPLDTEKVKKIAVIGKLADVGNIGDHGSSRVYPPYAISPLEGIKNSIKNNYNNNCSVLHNSGKKIDAAVELATNCDVCVIVVGYTDKEEGEFMFTKGGDRENLTLTKHDEALISSIAKINQNCIVVMETGSALITENWRKLSGIQSILMAWYPGMEGGNAIADVLFGKINPSGKLPCTFPKDTSQLPFFDKKAKEITYDYYHGYNLCDKEGYEPAFPFGFGLSYTTYEYSQLNAEVKGETIQVSVDVKNSGNVDGEEIVQLYVGYINSSVERHKKDLRGFTRVGIKSGQKKTISLTLHVNDLAYYDITSKSWVVEPIQYEILVGSSSSEQDLLKTEITIQ